MADTKITALAAIGANPIIPSTFPIPMVDLTDTSMAASGTTKKVTVNQILQAGGTATLASATITGDLTVRTNKLFVNATGVGVGTTSLFGDLNIQNGTNCRFELGSAAGGTVIENLNNARNAYLDMTMYADAYIWNRLGSEAMRLNSTGLGVGGSPNERFNVFGTCNTFGDSRFNVAFFDTASATTGTGAGLAFSGYTNGTTSGSTFGQIKGIKENSTAGNTAGALVFSTTANAANPTERLRIDSSGNVGIGVTPSAWAAAYKAVQQQFGASFFTSNSGSIGLSGNCYNDGTNWIYSSNNPATRYEIGPDAGNHRWFSQSAGTGTISFGDAKMTLDASGNLLVGTTADSFQPTKGIAANASNSSRISVGHANGTASGDYYHSFAYNGAVIGSITQSGTTGVAFNATSDYRLKEAVQPLVGGLARVSALKPSIYKWKADGSNGEGFLAHELAEVVPAAVSGEKDAVNEDGSIKPQGVDMSRVVPILVAAIQELTARVQTLETR